MDLVFLSLLILFILSDFVIKINEFLLSLNPFDISLSSELRLFIQLSFLTVLLGRELFEDFLLIFKLLLNSR
jgi:hypothetical protein